MLGKSGFLALAHIICVINASIQDIKELSDRLLANYSKHILPNNINNEKDNPFNIKISFELAAIGGIDEVEEKLSTVLRIIYQWKDESIHWNLEDTNVKYITLGWSDVWKPVLRVTNPQTDSSQAQYCDRSYETVFFDHDGWAYFDELVTTRTTCDMNMEYYPFDEQTCEINMTLTENSKFWFNLTVDISQDYTEHGSWNLTSMTSSAKKDDFGSVVIKLVFKRYPLFLLLNVVFPLSLLALLLPFVFLLPKKSGERVGYCVAMLLAISVYMTIVSNYLPQKSYPAPLLIILVFIAYTFDAVVVLFVIVITKIYLTTPDKPLGSTCSKMVKFISFRNCSKRTEDTRQNRVEMGTVGNKNDGSEGMHNSEDTQQIRVEMGTVGNENDGSEGMHNAANGKDVIVTRKDLSHKIDIWCFGISFVVKLFMPVIFYIVMVKKGQA